MDLENGIELGHLEELADLRAGVEELGLAALLLRQFVRARTRAPRPELSRKPTAERSTSRLTRPSSSSRVIVFLKVVSALADDEVSGHGQDRDFPVVAGCQFHKVGGLCQSRVARTGSVGVRLRLRGLRPCPGRTGVRLARVRARPDA